MICIYQRHQSEKQPHTEMSVTNTIKIKSVVTIQTIQRTNTSKRKKSK